MEDWSFTEYLDANFWQQLLVALLAAILVAFIFKFLKYISQKLSELYLKFNTSYRNKCYKAIASRDTQKNVIVIILYACILVLLVSGMTTAQLGLRSNKALTVIVTLIEQAHEKTENKLLDVESEKNYQPSNSFIDITKTIELHSLIDGIMIMFCSILMLLITMFVSFVLSINNKVIKETRNFDHLLLIVKPYLTQSEHDQMLSEFSLISDKDGYDTLFKSMIDLADKSEISLPSQLNLN